jgi:hypothetical protein
MAHLDQFNLDDVPETAHNLTVLRHSLSVISVATEEFGHQSGSIAGTTWIYEVSEPDH